jgi:hypothetical protein
MVLEPVVGQVYFAPECHTAYEALGFGPSPAFAGKVALPDGPAYFTSRGSCMGQVPGELVAAAFAVFNPAVVVPSIHAGWALTDAATIAAARTAGAIAQLERILGPSPEGLARATELLARATGGLRPEGRPLYAGVLSLGLPGDPLGDMWRLGDQLREYRGDSHTGAWISAGLDAVEIGLLTELYLGLPMRSYIRTRAWSDDELDDAEERLRSRGLVADGALTDAGRSFREDIEQATDGQVAPALDALGDDVEELLAIMAPWGELLRAEGGYLAAGAGDLARAARSAR